MTPFTVTSNQAQLQVEAAFLPGRIAENHISLIAKHLLRVVGSVSKSTGMVSGPVAALTKRLGEPCIELGDTLLIDWRCLNSTSALAPAFELELEVRLELELWGYSMSMSLFRHELWKETFGARFLSSSKYNVAAIMIDGQNEFKRKLESCLNWRCDVMICDATVLWLCDDILTLTFNSTHTWIQLHCIQIHHHVLKSCLWCRLSTVNCWLRVSESHCTNHAISCNGFCGPDACFFLRPSGFGSIGCWQRTVHRDPNVHVGRDGALFWFSQTVTGI